MADINEEFQRAQQEAARAMQRLAASVTQTSGMFGTAGNTVRASAQGVGQGLIRLRNDLDRGRVGYRDATQALRALENQFENLTYATRQSAVGQRLAEEQQKIGAQLLKSALGDSAAELTKIGIASIFKYQLNQISTGIKAIQDNAGGMQTAFQLQNQALTDQIAILGKFENALASSAEALALIPSPYSRAAAVIAGVGSGLAGLLSSAKELQLKGFTVLQTELLKSQESFKAVTGAGALFSNGITDIRAAAADANLDLKEFSVITAQNSELFARLGGSVQAGVTRFVAVNKAMADNRMQLLNLGYGYEQQAQATAEYMDRLQKSGKLMNQSPEELAKGTAEYLKHLKAVSALTGEDEKRLKQRQQQARDQAAVQVMLREAGGEAAQKFDNLVGKFPGYEKAIQQLFTVGEVTDPVLATVLANNQELDTALRQGVENVRNNNINAKDAQQETERYVRQNAAALQRNADEFGKIAGTVASVNGGLQGQADLTMATSNMARRAGQAQKEGADLSLDAVEKMARTTDGLTAEMSRAEIAFRETASAFTKDILPIIQKFAVEGLGGFKGLAETIRDADKKIKDAVKAFTGLTVGAQRNQPQGRETTQQQRERIQNIPGNERATEALEGGLGSSLLNNRRYRGSYNLPELASNKPESAPIAMSLSSLTDDSSNKFRDSFVQAMVSYQQQRATAGTVTNTSPETLSAVTDTLREVFSGQNGFNQVVVQLKDELSADNDKQIAVLQKQADKLENLLDVMTDNTEYTRRMANELA